MELFIELLHLPVSDDYEYEVVAVIRDNADIKNRDDLRSKRLCHPGYGYESNEWTRTLANVIICHFSFSTTFYDLPFLF